MTTGADFLKELHLERIPTPRMEVPIPRASMANAGQLVNFKKALSCVDPIETAAFERFLPGDVKIDQSLPNRHFVPGWSYALCVPTDTPLPVNERITFATGAGSQPNRENCFVELAIGLRRAYYEYGARGMSQPLVWRTSGAPGSDGRPTAALLGVCVTFDRRPPDGETSEALMNDVGLIAPKADIVPDPEGLKKALLDT